MLTDERNATFSPKDPGEVIPLSFDFSVFSTTGLSNPVVTCSHFSGVYDASASAMVLSAETAVSGGIVTTAVQNGVDNADYLLTATVYKGTLKYTISAILPVRIAQGQYSQCEIIS